jgi:hypothetical protein
MSRLNEAARAELRNAGVAQRAWARHHFADGRWHGDRCGCPDDRCIGHHHDAGSDCGCLRVLLEELMVVEPRRLRPMPDGI